MGLISSLGKRPSRLHCSMMGMRFSSMNLRVLSRTRRSSSVSSVSNSMKSTPLNFSAILVLSDGNFADEANLRSYQAEESGVKPMKQSAFSPHTILRERSHRNLETKSDL